MMLHRLATYWRHQRLKDPAFAYLLEPIQSEDEVVCVDCETTDLNPRKAEILSIGAVRIRGNRILTSEKLELFIKPKGQINKESIKVHQLRYCDVANGMDLDTALRLFLEFTGSRPLVGYYLEFDVAMLNKYLKPWLGIGLCNKKIEVSGLFYDCQLKRHGSGIAQGHIDLRFDKILQDLDLPVLGKHDAFNDALMTAMMYVKLRNGCQFAQAPRK